MATLLLTAGVSSLGLSGFSLFAANLAATAIGTFIDNRLFGVSQNVQQEGPRLQEISVTTSSEGQPIKRLYGRSRIGGNMIWVTNFREVKTTETQKTGGKGGGGGSTVTTTTYTYFISCAFAFCEGNERAQIGRIWADSKLLSTDGITFRFYPGSQTQTKDSKIVATEGTENVSAYRGVSYIVFEDLELTDFGNRIPQITAEIIVPLDDPTAEIMENLIEAVNLIPATGEAAYGTTPQIKDDGFGNAVAENIHLKADETDLQLSIENLVTSMPNVTGINLVISWFGTDLRMANCDIEPRVEVKENKILEPIQWRVSGETRSTANQVSQISVDGQDRPAFGGTPSDHTVVEAIQYMCDTQELEVAFYPFLLMDIPSGNTLPNPYNGGSPGQPVYPWRGRITTSLPSVDKTAAAQTEIDAFFGSVAAGDFSIVGTTVTYTGLATNLGFRGMVLHYAHLCAAAANTLSTPSRFKTFYIGTEMRGITQTRRNGVGVYPGVTQFNTLLNDVKAIFNAAGLTGVNVSYAADWSEYHSHRPDDGSGDVFFNLDPLWSNSNCAFVAIDNYVPLSDWRDGQAHADYGTTPDVYGNPRSTSIYDLDYLKGQIEGGELYDYFYASDADRTNQVRTAITDGAHSKPWVFRQKDFRNWWSNTHINRPGGTESGGPTAWTAGMKKIVFSEYGSPAVDKGTNQPNVFFDPKSSESFLPYFSNGQRDDQMQRVYYEAIITYWRDNSPTSPIKMIDPTDMFAWTWDARPYPAFPFRDDIWSDGENWNLGHWLNGRVGAIPLGELVKIICGWVGFVDTDLDVTGLVGSNTIVRGYVIDNMMSPREALNPLFSAYLFDGYETQGKIKFNLRANTGFFTVDTEDFVGKRDNPAGYEIERAQETELPSATRVSFMDEEKDFQIGSTGAQRQTTTSARVVELRFPIVLPESIVRIISEIVIQESWAARESIEFTLPPNKIGFDPGDGVLLNIAGRELAFRMTGISKGAALEVTAEGMDTTIYDSLVSGVGGSTSETVTIVGKTVLRFLDLPLVTGEEPSPWATRVAAYQGPFPPAVNIFEDTGTDLLLNTQIFAPTQMGILAADLPAGPHEIIDEGNIIQIDVNDTGFQVLGDTELNVRNGANAIAILTTNGDWEVLKFVNSALQTGRRYNLTRLFRGQLGTYPIMQDPIPAGQPVVFLDATTLATLNVPESRKFDSIDWRYGPNVYPTGSPFYQNATHTGQAVGQLPYPVADIQFYKESATDVRIEWKRQTRFGGEGYDQATVPLNESSEAYEIDLLNASDVLLLTVSTTSPSYTYASAPSVFKARIYQMSASVGRGRPAQRTYGA